MKIHLRFKELNNVGDNQGDEIGLLLTVQIIDDLKIDSKKTHKEINDFAFDENNKKNYPFYRKDIPWKFLTPSDDEVLILKGNKTIGNQSILSSTPNNNINFNTVGKKIIAEYNGPNSIDSAYAHWCGGTDTLFMMDIYAPKSLFAEVYTLCERDDDFENYCVDKDKTDPPRSGNHDYDGSLDSDCLTPIDSLPNPTKYQCINTGLDGTLDLFFMVLEANGVWKNRDNDPTKPNDTFKAPSTKELHKVTVHPSISTSGSRFCNERVLSNPTTMWNKDINGDGKVDAYISLCPSTPNIIKIQDDLNAVYEKIGVTFNVTNGGELYENYNIADYPNKTDGFLDAQWHHVNKFGNSYDNMTSATNTHIWIVKDLIGLRGVAVFDTMGNNKNSLMVSELKQSDRTIAHEVGHAKFQLFHPDGSGGSEKGYKNDGLKVPVSNDYYNFMNSGVLYPHNTNTDVTKYRVRRYQWKFIHDGK
ncbi:MAG: hypothetical protein ACJATI_004656 [Halioglobus sp.]